jgi:O-antigen ligase
MGLVFGTGLGQLIPLGLYVAAIAAALVSILGRPQYGLYYLIPLLPLQTTRYRLQPFPLGGSMVDILLLSIGIGLLLQGHGKLIPKTPLNKLLAFVALIFYISLWRGSFYLNAAMPLGFTDQRFVDWKDYMVMPLLCLLVVAALKDVKQIKWVVLLMILAAILVNVSFVHVIQGRDLSHFSNELRDAGTLGYAGENGFAAFEAEIAVFLLALFSFEKSQLRKIGLLMVALLTLYCLLFSFSRGAYAACIGGIALLGLLRDRKLLVGVLVVVIGWQVFLPTSVQERITMTYDKEEGVLDNSAAERVTLWQDAWQLSSKDLVFGTGFDTYGFMHRVENFADTHNYYLKVLVETGIVGLLLFLYLLAKFFGQGFALFRSSEDPFLRSLGLGLAAMICCAVAANLFGDRWTYLQVNGFLWVLLGCVLRGRMIEQESKEAVVSEVAPEGLLSSTARPVSTA